MGGGVLRKKHCLFRLTAGIGFGVSLIGGGGGGTLNALFGQWRPAETLYKRGLTHYEADMCRGQKQDPRSTGFDGKTA